MNGVMEHPSDGVLDREKDFSLTLEMTILGRNGGELDILSD